MKKIVALAVAFAMILCLAACGKTEEPAETTAPAAEETAAPAQTTAAEETAAPAEEAEGVMTFEEFAAAELDTEVTVECYVQAHQSWWDEKITVYAQDEDGAYFFYNMACTEEDAEKLVPGTKIRATGYKAEWAGEVEITDATFEIIDGSFIAEANDVTELLGTDELISHQNEFVAFTGMTVEDAGNGTAYMYKWDGSGSDGDDLYFNVSYNGETYSFTVESYLTGAGTDVYEGVKALSIGDTVDMEGFLYWYEGINPHITSVTVK